MSCWRGSRGAVRHHARNGRPRGHRIGKGLGTSEVFCGAGGRCRQGARYAHPQIFNQISNRFEKNPCTLVKEPEGSSRSSYRPTNCNRMDYSRCDELRPTWVQPRQGLQDRVQDLVKAHTYILCKEPQHEVAVLLEQAVLSAVASVSFRVC